MGKTIDQLNSGDSNLGINSQLVVWSDGATQKASLGKISAQTSFLKTTVSPNAGSSEPAYSRCGIVQPDGSVPTGGPDLDPNLTLDMDEIGEGFFEVRCSAVFTGSPPIAFINEPAGAAAYGTTTVRKLEFVSSEGRPSFTGVAFAAGYIKVVDEITSVIYPHTAFSDFYEPMFFYGSAPDCQAKYGPGWGTNTYTCDCVPPEGFSSSSSYLNPPQPPADSAWGYMVEIKVTVQVSAEHEPVGLRWCSSDGNPTTIIGGEIVAHKLNHLP